MCGIVGAISQKNIVPILIEGLKRLEYRGYDSAGIAVIQHQHLSRVRSTGRVKQLEEEVNQHQVTGFIGIAHTRWATHGVPSERNAHPHVSLDGVAVVHNGIIENYEELRRQLQSEDYLFTSETDTEVIAHLVHSFYRQHHDLKLAVRESLARLEGAYAIAVMVEDKPHQLMAARLGSPLLIGLGEEGYYLASDASALISVTQKMLYLEEGDVVELTHTGYSICDAMGESVERPFHISELSADNVELGPYQHYMQKEIAEQPRAITDTVEKVLGLGFSSQLFGATAQEVLPHIKGVMILACGTSYHAGLVARYWVEHITQLPCVVEVASEYRYRTSVPQTDYLVVTISQSGETADTQAALKHAKALGHHHTLTICNVPESALIRQSELSFLTRAGIEIGVASTKAFTTQLVALFSLAVVIAKEQERLTKEHEGEYLDALRRLPNKIQHVLNLEPQLKLWADRIAQKEHVLFLGRGIHYPIALEGSLKLKEISYIHAEAYPAGELKHGPLALVDERMPVIAVAPNDNLLEKLKSNLQEVKARGGVLYVIADNDSHFKAEEGIHVIRMPDHEGILSPIMHVVPLQLLAYHVACQRGTDVDKPRNLAKSVTVE
ncbi:MAG: glutamine-fructose-6-phosphate transaminase (isomerizing) [Ferrovum sp. 37-45-19]|uniref:glutamine--fructose-6-phosphate transaminase (isomerizing) n=1 Tax=Ferrovum sp. JA12 TaxID=1356299 RepID=UPI0007027DE5|nr:glutamine--fructose-6-phosphate transaminase (isomerizing) [Ferrovum sp. JA12]OYV80636.1 MAG: glutamine-fructose-6-phosphate transaminase (isomerizing) [Ferrovum sp. 21-44-67]OYV95187.1 MAG: glutamine-fructose-6-phosphate transaminase (isomerizing) [Ferrovum sp. 37-45-19]HQT80684.1 glutamine--fructose-6-phosphate transaminase (isomerizing) [Ferrovaceae bacterium]KRH79775.1 glutamine--fructose-6-phosphate aminotransferase [Ferrovum sp. JA12]HQU05894.1 glutamine--fructose-6-phosphate transami